MPAPVTSVVVHPLVLLSVVDHYTRVAKGTDKRVIGVLLGEQSKGRVDVVNSYAVPFEEDATNPDVWFVDHNYHENMFAMFKKVNAREHVVGWYSTGPRLRPNDLAIHAVWGRFAAQPVLVVIDVQPSGGAAELPTQAYVAVEEARPDGSTGRKLEVVAVAVGAAEAEEVGVEHLLRDVAGTGAAPLPARLAAQRLALGALHRRLIAVARYLGLVATGRLPPAAPLLAALQDVCNLLPNLSAPALLRAFAVQTNDMMLAIYLSSLIRSVVALHNLIRNKVALRDAERKLDNPEPLKKDTRDSKEKAALDGKADASKDASKEKK